MDFHAFDVEIVDCHCKSVSDAESDAAHSSGRSAARRDERVVAVARQLAKPLGVPTNRGTSLVDETRALTADTALRLARYFGTSPEFWLNLQPAYALRCTQQAGARIAQEVVPRAAMS